MKRLVLFMMAVMLLSITVNAQKKGGKTLVAYFSATGTTARAAKLVAEAVDGTFYEIQPAKKYTAADLDWHDKASRSSVRCRIPNHVLHCILNWEVSRSMIPFI